MAKTIAVGQVWRHASTGNRWVVRSVSGDFVRVEALDGGRFGDAMYDFHRASFEPMALVSSAACEVCGQRAADVVVTIDSALRSPVKACASCALTGVGQGACTW